MGENTKKVLGAIAGCILGIISVLAISSCTVTFHPVGVPETHQTAKEQPESSTEPSSGPMEHTVPNADTVANEFPDCQWTDASVNSNGVYIEILNARDNGCGNAEIQWTGIHGFADGVKERLDNGSTDMSGYYFVNGDTWLMITTDYVIAQNTADYFNAEVEEF